MATLCLQITLTGAHSGESMAHFLSNEEKADMHMAYGAADGNGREASRLYHERFPNRYLPGRQMFTDIHRRLRENGTLNVGREGRGRPRAVRDGIEDAVLQYFGANPRSSTRAAAHHLGIPDHVAVWRVLHQDKLHPYHFQKVQDLLPQDHIPRVNFARWALNKVERDEHFFNRVLFTDEATFTRAGVFNTHNMHAWHDANPQNVHRFRYQHRFTVNVWVGICGDHLIGPYLMPSPLNGARYVTFLRDVLPELLEEMPLGIRRRMWFQHDGAPAHYHRDARQHLDASFPNKWIGRNGPVAWPARSPDLNPLDFFLWGYMKTLVYDTPVESEMDLTARIAVAAGDIAEDQQMLSRVTQSFQRRCQVCTEVNGGHFEQLL